MNRRIDTNRQLFRAMAADGLAGLLLPIFLHLIGVV